MKQEVGCGEKIDSEDRIKKEEVKVSRQDCETDDESEIIRQIEQMQIKEKKMIEDIKQKERQQEIIRQKSELERLRLRSEKLKRDRIEQLRSKRDELKQSLLEKESTLSSLDDELNSVDMTKEEPKVKKAKAATQKATQPLIHKSSVPKLSDEQNFAGWKLEIQGMVESGIYHTEVLKQAVRNAISGKMRTILTTLKSTATIEEILATLETNFGDIKSGESIMEEFYTAKQEKDEDISAWGVRLKTIIQKAVRKGQILESKTDDMLKTRFWRYMKNTELRNATRVYFDTAETFEDLKKKVRREEQEMKISSEKPKQVNVQQVDQMKMLKDLSDQMRAMEEKMNRMSKEREGKEEYDHQRGLEYRRGGSGSYTGYRSNSRGRSFSRGRGYGRGDTYRRGMPGRGSYMPDNRHLTPEAQHRSIGRPNRQPEAARPDQSLNGQRL